MTGASSAPRRAVCLAAALLALASCTSLRKDSAELIDQGRWQEGLARLEQGMKDNPGDPELRIHYFRVRDQVLNRVLASAGADAAAGRLDLAAEPFRQVLRFDPTNSRAIEGLAAIDTAQRHRVLAADARDRLDRGDETSADLMASAILNENPGHTEARAIERELRERERKKALALAAAKGKPGKPVSLEFRDAPLKLVLEALSRSVGINFIIDGDVRPELKATIFVKDVSIEQAIDMILAPNQLARKMIGDKAMLVYPNTPQKQREHQELVMRAFHISNADPKQTLNLIRTMLKTKDVFVDERVNLLVMRDTPDAIRLAEKLIATQDLAEPEVLLELEILEVSRNRVRDLGISYPTVLSGPTGTLADIKVLNQNTVGADAGFKIRLLRTDGETKTLANPRVRVRNKEKAKIHIGDRVPVISSTIVGTTTGAAGAQAVTTEQIQYLDVGIKVDAEPVIHLDDTVAVKINLEVSSLGAQTKTNAGTTAYEIGTRNASTVLRLRDGETQALMGLIRDDDTDTRAGLPFIGEVPILDHLFGTKKTDRRSRELVLLITPQMIRGLPRLDPTAAEFWSGTESTLRNRAPITEIIPAAGAAAGAAPLATTINIGSAPQAATSQPLQAPPGALQLSWNAPRSARAGDEISVALIGRSERPLRGATVQLRYDPARFELAGVEDGGFFKVQGAPTVFTPRVEPGQGMIIATLGVEGNAAGVQGQGALLNLRLRALKGSGSPRITLSSVIGLDEANRRVPVDGATALDLVLEP